jgi:CheY-like chemotaxis protein
VVIRVKDPGCGIAPEVLPRVFELFFQGPQADHGSDGGMGVGLTIAKNLVEMHGGTIAAASDGPGQGAEFVIRLPRMTEVDAVTDRGLPLDLVGAEAEVPRRLRILVVDDNEDAALSLAALLRLDGHQVVVATTPAQALATVPQLRPHVALLDIGLPGMSGYDLGVKIRQMLEPRGCRLFAVTGYGQESDRLRSTELGFVDHLVKPVNHELLLRHLAESAPALSSHS